MFTDRWFGGVDETFHIINSRWKNSLMPKQMDPKGVRNSYGFIRSYWNNNEDVYIQRSLFNVCGSEDKQKRIPTCRTHFSVMNLTSLAQFQLLVAANGHGPMHVQTGGVFGGCEDDLAAFAAKWGTLMDTNLTDDEIITAGYNPPQFHNKWGQSAPRRAMYERAIVGEFFHIYRSLWRSHMCTAGPISQLLVCPEICDSNTPFEDCKCGIPSLHSGETEWMDVFQCLFNNDANREYFKSTMPEEMLKDLVYVFATTSVKEGEMLESASPADILFWMIHPVRNYFENVDTLCSGILVYRALVLRNPHFSKYRFCITHTVL